MDLRNHCSSWGKSKSNSSNSKEDNLDGFSWPPTSYACAFCKREFRCAQALGGHMNVHRRDRARLRQMTPSSSIYMNLLNPSPNPNPNLSPYFSSSPSPYLSPSTTYPLYRLSPKGHANLTVKKCHLPTFGDVCKFDGLPSENGGEIVKNSEIVWLNLEIGLLGDSKPDDLDLELRLGCA